MGKRLVMLVFVLAVSSGLFMASASAQEEYGGSEELSAKVDIVLRNQEKIIRMLEEMKQELVIIKIRATK